MLSTNIHSLTSLQSIGFQFLSPEKSSKENLLQEQFKKLSFKADSRRSHQCWTEWLSNTLLRCRRKVVSSRRRRIFIRHQQKGMSRTRKLRGKRMEKIDDEIWNFIWSERNFYLISLSLPFKLNLDLLLEAFLSSSFVVDVFLLKNEKLCFAFLLRRLDVFSSSLSIINWAFAFVLENFLVVVGD